MASTTSGFSALVIGDRKQLFVQRAAGIFSQKNVNFQICSDPFAAMAAIVKCLAPSQFIIIAQLRTLLIEDMRLLNMPARHGVLFIGIVQNGSVPIEKISAAMEAGVQVINNVDRLENIVDELTLGGQKTDITADKQKGSDFRKKITAMADRFFLTASELSALLEKK